MRKYKFVNEICSLCIDKCQMGNNVDKPQKVTISCPGRAWKYTLSSWHDKQQTGVQPSERANSFTTWLVNCMKSIKQFNCKS